MVNVTQAQHDELCLYQNQWKKMNSLQFKQISIEILMRKRRNFQENRNSANYVDEKTITDRTRWHQQNGGRTDKEYETKGLCETRL